MFFRETKYALKINGVLNERKGIIKVSLLDK